MSDAITALLSFTTELKLSHKQLAVIGWYDMPLISISKAADVFGNVILGVDTANKERFARCVQQANWRPFPEVADDGVSPPTKQQIKAEVASMDDTKASAGLGFFEWVPHWKEMTYKQLVKVATVITKTLTVTKAYARWAVISPIACDSQCQLVIQSKGEVIDQDGIDHADKWGIESRPPYSRYLWCTAEVASRLIGMRQVLPVLTGSPLPITTYVLLADDYTYNLAVKSRAANQRSFPGVHNGSGVALPGFKNIKIDSLLVKKEPFARYLTPEDQVRLDNKRKAPPPLAGTKKKKTKAPVQSFKRKKKPQLTADGEPIEEVVTNIFTGEILESKKQPTASKLLVDKVGNTSKQRH
jgi:hypothetical protein